MTLEIEHQLSYSYSDYVGLNPHYFYLSPKASPYQKVLNHDLSILPKPDLLVKNIDQESNIQHICFINQLLKTFEVKSTFTIKTEDFNALNFVFFPFETAKIPFKYPTKLGNYAGFILENQIHDAEVKEYGIEMAEKTKFDTVDFLMELTTHIHHNFRYISRERGDALNGIETLKSQSGSCRDFAVFMMEVCASVGLLARFVSGYLYGSELHQHELHAWVEVFLPGGGWRGFDPTEGRVVDKNYIALASSFESDGLNPIRGTFRSTNFVESILKTEVTIKEINL